MQSVFLGYTTHREKYVLNGWKRPEFLIRNYFRNHLQNDRNFYRFEFSTQYWFDFNKYYWIFCSPFSTIFNWSTTQCENDVFTVSMVVRKRTFQYGYPTHVEHGTEKRTIDTWYVSYGLNCTTVKNDFCCCFSIRKSVANIKYENVIRNFYRSFFFLNFFQNSAISWIFNQQFYKMRIIS